MFNKKGMELPQGVVIVALILIVLVIIILVFVVGGFGTVGQKLKDIFSSQTSGQNIDLAVRTCQNLCDSAKTVTSDLQRTSGYCRQTFMIDEDNNAKTALKKATCSATNYNSVLAVNSETSIGVECSEVQC